MKNLLPLFALSLPFLVPAVSAQTPDALRDRVWLLGTAVTGPGQPRHTLGLDFNADPAALFIVVDTMPDVDRTIAVIGSAQDGRLLLYTNGCVIADSTHQAIANGAQINVTTPMTTYSQLCYGGAYYNQLAVALPDPYDSLQYYFIYQNLGYVSPSPQGVSQLRYTTVRQNSASTAFAVLEKDVAITPATPGFKPGHLAACRHGNGRDWWIVAPGKLQTNEWYKLLLDSSGVAFHDLQAIGVADAVGEYGGNAAFSPDGRYFAAFGTDRQTLTVFDFDRCTGQLGDPVEAAVYGYVDWYSGMAFAPGSRYLYAGTRFHLYQFDLQAPDFAASKTLVAEFDNFSSWWGEDGAADFATARLGPDGRIYIASRVALHVIESPDSAGTACHVVQHKYKFDPLASFSVYLHGGLPYFPDFRLGADPLCHETTAVPTAADEPPSWLVQPNPVDQTARFRNLRPLSGAGPLQLEIYAAPGGRCLLHTEPAGSLPEFSVDLSALPAGSYFWKIRRDGLISAHGKLIKS